MPRFDIIYQAYAKGCKDRKDAIGRAKSAGFKLLAWNGDILLLTERHPDGFLDTGLTVGDLECKCQQK